MLILSSLVQEVAGASAAMRAALVGGGTAAAATALGTLPVLMSQSFSQRSYDSFLGFGAGVMLGASIGLGALLVYGLGRRVHVGQAKPRGRVWLFVAAVTLHNLPEGLAIGVAYAGPDIDKAHSLATGISIQDVPEGLVVALALRSVGHGRGFATATGALSGLIEPVAAAALISISAGLLPVGLAAAAGAMLFVIANDVLPESHRNGNGGFASAALTAGFILMTVLDTALS